MKNFFLPLLLLSICTFSYAQNPILEFDGVNDYVNLGPSAGNGVRTIELWFRPNQNINSSLSQFSSLIAKEQSIQNLGEFTLAFIPAGVTGAGKLRFALLESVSDAFYVYSDVNSWTAGQWHHVAAVVHPTQGMMLFIDGIKQTSTNSYTSATVTSNDPTIIGCWGSLYDRYFDGAIDDVRLSNQALYTSDFALPCPDQEVLSSTISLWNLNEGIGTTAADSSSNGYDATIVGASWNTADFCGNAIYLDGIDDHVDLGTIAGNSIRTIELWFNPERDLNSSSDQFSTLVAKEESIQNLGEFTLAFIPAGVTGAGRLRFALLESVSDAFYVYSDVNSWTAGQWHHVAAVVHPTQGMMLFIDGIKQTSTNSYTSATNTSSDLTTVGCWGTLFDRYFNGFIDDVRFSSEAIYSIDFTPPCPDQVAVANTVGLWNFNEGMGSVALDSSPNNFNGQLIGATRVLVDVCENPLISSVRDYNHNSINLVVYPNPSNGLYSFKLQDGINTNSELSIYDMQGKLVLALPVTTSYFQADLQNLASGIYTYNLIGERWVANGKLVKK